MLPSDGGPWFLVDHAERSRHVRVLPMTYAQAHRHAKQCMNASSSRCVYQGGIKVGVDHTEVDGQTLPLKGNAVELEYAVENFRREADVLLVHREHPGLQIQGRPAGVFPMTFQPNCLCARCTGLRMKMDRRSNACMHATHRSNEEVRATEPARPQGQWKGGNE